MKLLFQNNGVDLFAPSSASGKGNAPGSGDFAALFASIAGKLDESTAMNAESIQLPMSAVGTAMSAASQAGNGIVPLRTPHINVQKTDQSESSLTATVVVTNNDGGETELPVTITLLNPTSSPEDGAGESQAMVVIEPLNSPDGSDTDPETIALLKAVFGDALVANDDGSFAIAVPAAMLDRSIESAPMANDAPLESLAMSALSETGAAATVSGNSPVTQIQDPTIEHSLLDSAAENIISIADTKVIDASETELDSVAHVPLPQGVKTAGQSDGTVVGSSPQAVRPTDGLSQESAQAAILTDENIRADFSAKLAASTPSSQINTARIDAETPLSAEIPVSTEAPLSAETSANVEITVGKNEATETVHPQPATVHASGSAGTIEIPVTATDSGTVRIRIDIPEPILRDISNTSNAASEAVDDSGLAGLIKTLATEGESIDAVVTVGQEFETASETVRLGTEGRIIKQAPLETAAKIVASDSEGPVQHTAAETSTVGIAKASMIATPQTAAQVKSDEIENVITASKISDLNAPSEEQTRSKAATPNQTIIETESSNNEVLSSSKTAVSEQEAPDATVNRTPASKVSELELALETKGGIRQEVNSELRASDGTNQRAATGVESTNSSQSAGTEKIVENNAQIRPETVSAQSELAEEPQAYKPSNNSYVVDELVQNSETLKNVESKVIGSASARPTAESMAAQFQRTINAEKDVKTSRNQEHISANPEPASDTETIQAPRHPAEPIRVTSSPEQAPLKVSAEKMQHKSGEGLSSNYQAPETMAEDSAQTVEKATVSKTEIAPEKAVIDSSKKADTVSPSKIDVASNIDSGSNKTAQAPEFKPFIRNAAPSMHSAEPIPQSNNTVSVEPEMAEADTTAQMMMAQGDAPEITPETTDSRRIQHPSFAAGAQKTSSFKDRITTVSNETVQPTQPVSDDDASAAGVETTVSASASTTSDSATPVTLYGNRGAHVMANIQTTGGQIPGSPAQNKAPEVTMSPDSIKDTAAFQNAEMTSELSADTQAVNPSFMDGNELVDGLSAGNVKTEIPTENSGQAMSRPAVLTHDLPGRIFQPVANVSQLEVAQNINIQQEAVAPAIAAMPETVHMVNENTKSATQTQKIHEASLDQIDQPTAGIVSSAGNTDGAMKENNFSGGSNDQNFSQLFDAQQSFAGADSETGDAEILASGMNDFRSIVNTMHKTTSAGTTSNVPVEIENRVIDSVVRQAKIMVGNGSSNAVITLDPPNLGKLRLEIVTEQSKVSGRITVENQEAKEIIEHRLSELNDSLKDSGLKVESFDVQVGHNSGSDGWAKQKDTEWMMSQIKARHNSGDTVNSESDFAGAPLESTRRVFHNGMIDLTA